MSLTTRIGFQLLANKNEKSIILTKLGIAGNTNMIEESLISQSINYEQN